MKILLDKEISATGAYDKIRTFDTCSPMVESLKEILSAILKNHFSNKIDRKEMFKQIRSQEELWSKVENPVDVWAEGLNLLTQIQEYCFF